MVFAVTDTNGEVLGLYRMPDATTFSIDVAVAKARNVAYYADAADLQAIDQVPGIAAGTAFTNRTFRFLAQPRFPSGIDGTPPPEFSILNDDGIDDLTAENEGAPAPVSDFNSVLWPRRVLPHDQLPRSRRRGRRRRWREPIRPWPIRTASCSSPAPRRCTSTASSSAASASAATASIRTTW